MRQKTMIIAEAGVNHNGSLELAKKLIDVAAEAKADYVKFQAFKAKNLVSDDASMADYQKSNTGKQGGKQLSMLQELEMGMKEHQELYEYATQKGIGFLSSPFDEESADELEDLGIDIFKIPSGELINLPFLEHIGQKQKPVILSTGMATMSEIEIGLNTLLDAGVKREQISILHCNTEYPTPYGDVNLTAMNTIGKAFGVAIGYSDHTMGIEIPIAAVALGATIIEKHFTLDRTMSGPDHKASLEPAELKQMVSSIRNIEIAMGNGLKIPSPSELKNKDIARKSIHLNTSLPKGTILTKEHFSMKRPGHGISPLDYKKVIGIELRKDCKASHLLCWDDLKPA